MEEQAVAHATPSPVTAPPAKSQSSPSRIFWVTLSVILICGIICIAVTTALSFTQSSPKLTAFLIGGIITKDSRNNPYLHAVHNFINLPHVLHWTSVFQAKEHQPLLQVVRLNFQNRPGSPMNQSAFINKSKNTVTYYVTSPSNQTTSVLFDRKNGFICYKPSGQNHCYLRMMDAQDYDTMQMSFNLSEHRVDQLPLPNDKTQYYREFLGIVPGRPVRPEEAGGAIRSLCEQVPIYWVKKKDGPPKQRLIYLCIDICFPSNICVSICFYYLPE